MTLHIKSSTLYDLNHNLNFNFRFFLWTINFISKSNGTHPPNYIYFLYILLIHLYRTHFCTLHTNIALLHNIHHPLLLYVCTYIHIIYFLSGQIFSIKLYLLNCHRDRYNLYVRVLWYIGKSLL